MNAPTDQELLRGYVERQSDPAFSALLHRHVNLVHSTARRIVGEDGHLAEDVAQEVFRDLAVRAAELVERPLLGGWLHQATRFAACEVVRTETRRRAREQEAAAMNPIFADETEAAWQQVAPHLDAALVELPELDREMVILRYFERKSFQEIGLLMGVTDQAAQRRVSRGIERLRDLIAERGVTVSVTALGVAISANAIQAAPVGLAASIASALGITGGICTTVTTTNVAAMTALQKSIVVTSLVGLLGAGLFEVRQAEVRRAAAKSFAREQASWAEQMDQQRRELEEVKRQLARQRDDNRRLVAGGSELLRLRGEVGRLRAAIPAPNGVEIPAVSSWLNRIQRLRARLEQTPEAQVPELQLATDEDWLDASKGPLETDQDYRKALSTLRSAVEGKLVVQLDAALKRFLAAAPGQFPGTVQQLASYFDPPVDPALLARWKVVPAAQVDTLEMGGHDTITQTPVDAEFDRVWAMGPGGYGSASVQAESKTAESLEAPGTTAGPERRALSAERR